MSTVHCRFHIRSPMPQSGISHSMFCRSLVLRDFPGNVVPNMFRKLLSVFFLLKVHNIHQHSKGWEVLLSTGFTFKKKKLSVLNMSHRPRKSISLVKCINITWNSWFLEHTWGKQYPVWKITIKIIFGSYRYLSLGNIMLVFKISVLKSVL